MKAASARRSSRTGPARSSRASPPTGSRAHRPHADDSSKSAASNRQPSHKFDGRSLWPLLERLRDRLAGPHALHPEPSRRSAGPLSQLRRPHAEVEARQRHGLRPGETARRRTRSSSCSTWKTIPTSSTTWRPSIPEIVAKLKAEYEAWFDDVGSTRPDNYAPPRIIVGTATRRRRCSRGRTGAAPAGGRRRSVIGKSMYCSPRSSTSS